MEMQMELSYVFAVVITGLVVVFLGLVLLIAFISLIGTFFKRADKNKKAADGEKSTPVPAPKAAPVSVKPVQAADDDEVIAVISAAVAMMSETDGTAYKIKSVRAASNGVPARNAWASAGLRESTNPF